MMVRRILMSSVGVPVLCSACAPNLEPPAGARVPAASGCGTIALACYDELPRQPADVFCFRPQSRWNKTTLTWRLTNGASGLALASQLETAQRAVDAWAAVSGLSASLVAATDVDADISISFVSADHGDPAPFDGPGGTLGHAYFPGTVRAGDIHLCAEEPWSLQPAEGRFDLFTVVLHELGHALGLEHSPEEDSVMYPEYRPVSALSASDGDALMALYGSADGDIAPTAVRDRSELCEPPNLGALQDADTDGDGIPDSVEVFILDTDRSRADTDGDGADDFVEVFIDGTPPAAVGADADGDDLSDDDERRFGSDPQNPDSDGDGLTDGEEVWFYGTDPTAPDTDLDGFGDAVDGNPTDSRFPRDCNDNRRPDTLDVAEDASFDCNRNGVPDECELEDNDANGDGIPDECTRPGRACSIGDACNDADPCTSDACSPDSSICAHRPVAGCCQADTDCTDSDACTINRCIDGECTLSFVQCFGTDPCAPLTCDPETGGCIADPVVCPPGFACDPDTGDCRRGP